MARNKVKIQKSTKDPSSWLQLKVAESNMENDVKEQIMDILDDYEKQAEQINAFMMKYEIPARPKKMTEGIYLCSECNHRINPKYDNCHWCGKLFKHHDRSRRFNRDDEGQ